MITIMDSINNHFVKSVESQAYEITASSIKGRFGEVYLPGMRLIIKGSYLNDGIYTITNATTLEITLAETLSAENTGKSFRVYASAPPVDFVALCTEIEAYVEKGVGASSEKIDDYSITYAAGGDGSWQSVYKNKLNQYRRVYSDLTEAKNYRWQDRLGR